VHATIDRHVDPSRYGGPAETRPARRDGDDRLACTPSAERGGWRVFGPERCVGDTVVVSAAIGSMRLLRPHGLDVPLIGAKGYSVTVPHADPTPSLPLYLCEPKLGLTPLAAGLRIAGFFELGARNANPSIERARQLVEEARPFVAALDGSSFAEGRAGWAGFRPSTPDSLPLLGPVPGAPGLVVATGHGMLGVTLAPATGLAVAALVRGERPGWVAPFAPDRFRR
jgi:D-amino-acid dehydrogenase